MTIQRVDGRQWNEVRSVKITGLLELTVLKEPLAAISVGIVKGQPLLDLCYQEDSKADVDLNVVMTASGKFIEVQGTAEAVPFERKTLDALLDLAAEGLRCVFDIQRKLIDNG